jgi:SAM-dependent methyltransferase
MTTRRPRSLDWGVGRYEHTAAELEPAAETVVALARIRPSEEVLDVACGTGNAALLAARAGARATGVDRSQRLVDVARARAAQERLDVAFAVADAQALPFADASFDAVVSVFGVVFAEDADTAFGELVRVLRPGGRALVSAWEPAGALDAMVGAFRRAAAAASGGGAQRFPWHDRSAIAALAASQGVMASFHAASISFRGESPERYLGAHEEHHPMSVAMRPLLERAGSYAAAREEALAALRAGNEDPQAFRITAPFVVIELAR